MGADAAEERALILVADDERVARDSLSGILRSAGYEVEALPDGPQVIERVAKGGVDLVLLDVVMPRMTGLETCRMLKSLRAEQFLPVVLVTVKTDTDSRVEGLKIGADDYVCKPFEQRELLARVTAMLRIKRMHDQLAEARSKLEDLAIHDELTGLYNYRYLHNRLAEEFRRAERYHDPLACIMIDCDNFKEVNDRRGHDVGDEVLRELARRLRGAVRDVDVVARYGGEEFLLMLPSTHFAGALSVAERIWRVARGAAFATGAGPVPVTISLGVSLYPGRDVRTKDQLLKAADEALYRAKSEGRDRICVFQHQNYIYEPRLSSRPPPDADH